MDLRYQQFQTASHQYIEQTKLNKDVIGIVLTGSFVHGELHENSDLDVFVILDAACDYRERGNTWINEVEVEYFMNPAPQIRSYMATELSPHTAHMLAYGKVVYNTSKVVDELIEEAKALIEQSPPAIKDFQIELAKYSLDDLFKDLEDSIGNQDTIAIEFLKQDILRQSIDLFCKSYRIRQTKHKRLKAQLAGIDPEFAQLIETLVQSDWTVKKTTSDLKDYLKKILGGERSKEWVLRSGLDLK